MSNNDKWRHLFSQEEWNWAQRTSKAIHDPQEKKEFWANMIEVKQANQPVGPKTDKQRIADQFCSMILPVLKAGGQVAEKEVPKPETEFQKHLGKLVEQDFHLSDEDYEKKHGKKKEQSA